MRILLDHNAPSRKRNIEYVVSGAVARILLSDVLEAFIDINRCKKITPWTNRKASIWLTDIINLLNIIKHVLFLILIVEHA